MTANTMTAKDISDLEDRAPILGGLGARQEPAADGRLAPPVSGDDWDDWETFQGVDHTPEDWADWNDWADYDATYDAAMLVLDICVVCGTEFFHPSYPSRGRPRIVCSEECARVRDLHLRADLRIARDPLIGSDERKRNQIEGLRYLRQLQRQDREDAQLRRDLRAAGLTGMQPHDTGYEPHVANLAARHDDTRRAPMIGTHEDGSPPRRSSDPVWDEGTTSVYWQQDIVWRRRREDGSWESYRWKDETFLPPDGYEPNGPVALQPDGTPRVADRAPMQPWEPRAARPHRPSVLLADDLDAMALHDGDGE